MARYMLDTDTCSYIMKRSNQTVVRRLRAVPVADVCISVITKSELLYGVEVSPRQVQDATALQAFLPHVEVLAFPDAAATHYAQIRADLKKRGQMIGANDLLIAAHARSLGLRLVTNNTAEFGRVNGLAIENWTVPLRRSRSRHKIDGDETFQPMRPKRIEPEQRSVAAVEGFRSFTAKQGQDFAFIYYYTKIHGTPPAEADFRRFFGVMPPVVHQMIKTLQAHGFIDREPGKARSIKLRLTRAQLPDLD